jgi:hypothetical protein
MDPNELTERAMAPAVLPITRVYGGYEKFVRFAVTAAMTEGGNTVTCRKSASTRMFMRNENSLTIRLTQVKEIGLYYVTVPTEHLIREASAQDSTCNGAYFLRFLTPFYKNINPSESEFFLEKGFQGGDGGTKREFKCITAGRCEIAEGAARFESEMGEMLLTDYTCTRFICVTIKDKRSLLCGHAVAKVRKQAHRVFGLAMYLGQYRRCTSFFLSFYSVFRPFTFTNANLLFLYIKGCSRSMCDIFVGRVRTVPTL